MGSISGTCKCHLYSLFFFFQINVMWKIITAFSHRNRFANKHLLLQCVYRTKYSDKIQFLCRRQDRKRPIDTIWSLDCKNWLSETNAALWKRQLNISTGKDSFILFLFALASNWGETFTPLPSASVLTAKGRRSFLCNILKNIIHPMGHIKSSQSTVASKSDTVYEILWCWWKWYCKAVQMLKSFG